MCYDVILFHHVINMLDIITTVLKSQLEITTEAQPISPELPPPLLSDLPLPLLPPAAAEDYRRVPTAYRPPPTCWVTS